MINYSRKYCDFVLACISVRRNRGTAKKSGIRAENASWDNIRVYSNKFLCLVPFLQLWEFKFLETIRWMFPLIRLISRGFVNSVMEQYNESNWISSEIASTFVTFSSSCTMAHLSSTLRTVPLFLLLQYFLRDFLTDSSSFSLAVESLRTRTDLVAKCTE